MQDITVSFSPTEDEAIEIFKAAFKNKKMNGRRITIAVISALIIADNAYAAITSGTVTVQNIIFTVLGLFFLFYAFVISPNLTVKRYAAVITEKEVLLQFNQNGIFLEAEGESIALTAEKIVDCFVTEGHLIVSHRVKSKNNELILPKRIFNDEQLEAVISLLGGKDGITNE